MAVGVAVLTASAVLNVLQCCPNLVAWRYRLLRHREIRTRKIVRGEACGCFTCIWMRRKRRGGKCFLELAAVNMRRYSGLKGAGSVEGASTPVAGGKGEKSGSASKHKNSRKNKRDLYLL